MLKFSCSSDCTTRTERGVPSSSRSVMVPAAFDESKLDELALSTSFLSLRAESGPEPALGTEPKERAGMAGAPLLPDPPPPKPAAGRLSEKPVLLALGAGSAAAGSAAPGSAAAGGSPRAARKESSRLRVPSRGAGAVAATSAAFACSFRNDSRRDIRLALRNSCELEF
jgi:hypothetical protein